MQGTGSQPGIIPRSVEQVLKLKSDCKTIISITASYLEIYNEKVYDLLNTSNEDLPVRQDATGNIFIPKLEEVPIESIEDFQKTYDMGCKNRTVGATKLNSKSSRSHAIMMLKISQKEKASSTKTLIGKLHMIDLAGSEDNRRTDNTGIRLTESTNINQSLFVLGKVVNALHKGLVTRFTM